MSTENIPMYYYSENGEVVGPFTVQELAGKITPDSLVVSENATKWVKASDVPEISDILFVQLPDEAEEFIPDELDVEDDSLLEVETENLEIVTPSGPVLEGVLIIDAVLVDSCATVFGINSGER